MPLTARKRTRERNGCAQGVSEGFANDGFLEGSEMDFQSATVVAAQLLCPLVVYARQLTQISMEGLRIKQVVYLELARLSTPHEWKVDEKKAHESLQAPAGTGKSVSAAACIADLLKKDPKAVTRESIRPAGGKLVAARPDNEMGMFLPFMGHRIRVKAPELDAMFEAVAIPCVVAKD
uniref:DEAD domain-containing protein n=1 Tax=Globodera pallida TaxID=36090 RepID=A0A183BTY3_GLOPA